MDEKQKDIYEIEAVAHREVARKRPVPEDPSALEERIADIDRLPRRNWLLHWSAFVFSLVSLVPPAFWLSGRQSELGVGWLWFDIGLAIFFAIEYFTRSGFRWNPVGYTASHLFDFVAIAPSAVLVHFDVPFLAGWVWIILVARVVRVINRLLGDGFVTRNILALIAAVEEEITDRVLIRIMDRIHDDMKRGKFGQRVSESLLRNKESVLERIRAEHPQRGIAAGVARLTGLDAALSKAEARTYDAIVEVLASPEIERAIHEAVDSSFSVMREQIRVKDWRKNLGIRR